MLKTACCVAGIQLSKSIRRTRTICAFILLIIVSDYYLRGVRDVCAASGYSVSLWGIIALFMSAPNSACLLTMLFAMITCDLPGKDEAEPYVFIRSGLNGWIYGKIIAAVLYGILFTLIVSLSCLIVLNQYCSFEPNWDKVLYTLTRTDAVETYDIQLYISAKLIGKYSASSAYLYSMGLNALLYSFLAVWELTLNTFTGKTMGNIIVVGLAYLNQELGGFDLSYEYLKYSPCSWASLEAISDGTLSFRPTIVYSISAMLIGITAAVFVLTVARKKISVYSR